tara:strand:- start:54 stop:275 length:222 start_codon:yes stop_codon:yes gene_type:complete
MFYYKIHLYTKEFTKDGHQVREIIDGYCSNGKMSKRMAEQLAREELSDPKYTMAEVFDSKGRKRYSRRDIYGT